LRSISVVGLGRELLDQPFDIAVAELAGIQPLAQFQRQQLDRVAERVALAKITESPEQMAEVAFQRRRIEQSGIRKGPRLRRQVVAQGPCTAVTRQRDLLGRAQRNPSGRLFAA